MCGLSGGSAPSIPPAPPIQPEAPDASKRVTVSKDSDARRRAAAGHNGTKLTGGRGLTEDANTSNTRQLLGG